MKVRRKTSTAKITTNKKEQGYKHMTQILDFLLKLVSEQEWFHHLFMSTKFESTTVNKTKVIKA